ncbi:SDR family NAD(P)-dependent oxidoreductase [Streptomyces sp. NPDC059454]|jgi:NAD(P)-dependent dehydrogenase (short-subunit alcohol dehydrogenase family)|uniref:SDR family NAD(P)-dependent oxidoreductase n=1 Tax=Streptomyces sp. NPDC059454 TaxID=3346836 RepID=UPI00367A1B3F
MRLDGTVAVVTGGTTGLGLATARRLIAEGAKTVLVGRTEAAGKAAAEELGPAAAFVAADVRLEEDVARAMDVAEEMGPLRTLVCCAGGAHSKRMMGRRPMRLEEFATVVETNLTGTFNAVRQAVPRIVAQPLVDGERGVVVTTSSIAAWDGQAGQSAYAASKAAIVGMTLPLARELAEHAVRVVTVAPGLFQTGLLETVPPPVRDLLRRQIPHPQRMGEPDEFAAFVAHVIDNPMLNGETIRLDAALRMPVL